jgi:cobalt-precorrin 5A hydrolase
MELDQDMIVAGIGCRRGASADQIETVIAAALAQVGLDEARLAMIATAALKGGERGIMDAAAARGVPLVLVPQDDLEAAGARTLSYSERVVAIAGVPSLAEAAALAAGGALARLIARRIAVGPATCALALAGESLP